MPYQHVTKMVKDRVLHRVVSATGEVVEEYPPGWEGYSGQRLRQYVLDRVATLNREERFSELKPIEELERREYYPRRIWDFSAAERTMVFVTKKCIRCFGKVYDFPKDGYNYCSACDLIFYVRPKEPVQ